MNYVYAFISLLSGLGAFLLGFKILSESVEKLANNRLRKLFSKKSNNRFIQVGIGALVTAIIQSSSASTVMIVGLVNSNMISLFQATALIMGANIGTTITAQIVALESFDFINFAMICAFIGVFMNMLAKKDKTKTAGLALAGLGLVFLALKFMSTSMSIFKESQTFVDLLSSISNPFLLLLIGIFFTALLQSSSAVTTMLISMVGSGIVIGAGGNSILYVILGSNIGTCITALFSSLGASTNAKRASVIHLLFNVFATTLFMIVLLCFPRFNEFTFAKWFSHESTQIAMFHTFFNVASTLIFIGFINVFVKLSMFFVKDKKQTINDSLIDDRFLRTPSIAISQTVKETIRLGTLSMESLNLAIDSFVGKDLSQEETIKEKIKEIDLINEHILSYLIKISSKDLSEADDQLISSLHHMLNDFYREAEISDNLLKYTKSSLSLELTFSEDVYKSLNQFKEMLNQQFENVKRVIETNDEKLLLDINALEEEIDNLRSKLISEHIARLEEGICKPSSSGVFINLVSNLERAGDHLNYIANSFLNK